MIREVVLRDLSKILISQKKYQRLSDSSILRIKKASDNNKH